LASGS